MSSVYNTEPPTNGKVILKTTVGDIDIELWPKEAQSMSCQRSLTDQSQYQAGGNEARSSMSMAMSIGASAGCRCVGSNEESGFLQELSLCSRNKAVPPSELYSIVCPLSHRHNPERVLSPLTHAQQCSAPHLANTHIAGNRSKSHEALIMHRIAITHTFSSLTLSLSR